MSRTLKGYSPKIKPPVLPDIPTDAPFSLRPLLAGIRENLQLLNYGLSVRGDITRIQQQVTKLTEVTVNLDKDKVEDPPQPSSVAVSALSSVISVSWVAPSYVGHSHTNVYVQQSKIDSDGNPVDSASYSDDKLWATSVATGVSLPIEIQTQAGVYVWLRHVNIAGEVSGLYTHEFTKIPMSASTIIDMISGEIDFGDLNSTTQKTINDIETGLSSTDDLVASHTTLIDDITKEDGEIDVAIETYNTKLTSSTGAIATTVENHTVTVDGETYSLSDTVSVAVQNKSDFSGFWQKSLTSVDGITTNVGLYADSTGKTSFVVRADNLTFVNADKKTFNPFNFDTTTGIAYMTGTVTGSLKIQDSTKTIAHIDDTKAVFDVSTFAIKDSNNDDFDFTLAVTNEDIDGDGVAEPVVLMENMVVKNATMENIKVTGQKSGTTYSTQLTDVEVLGDSRFTGVVDVTGGKIKIGANFDVDSNGNVTATNIKASGDIEATSLKANEVIVNKEHIKAGATTTLQYANYSNKWDISEEFSINDDTKHYTVSIEIRNDSDWQMWGTLDIVGRQVLSNGIQPKIITTIRDENIFLDKNSRSGDRLVYSIPIVLVKANRISVAIKLKGSRGENPDRDDVKGMIAIDLLEYHR